MQNATNAAKSNKSNATVGKNDTSKAAETQTSVADFSQHKERIEQLIVDREVWEQTVVRTCNEQLYGLLAKCYALYFEMCGKTAQATAFRSALDSVIGLKGYRFLSGTHTLTKIVKCVFGVDRRRVSAYSLVLREALAQKLKTEEIADFIANAGGVEEVRRRKSETALTPKQRAELGKQAIGHAQLAVIRDDTLAEKLDLARVDTDLVAIVTQQADGSFIVRALVNSQTVLNAALACAYSENKTVVQNDRSNEVAANSDQFRDDAIKAAANS